MTVQNLYTQYLDGKITKQKFLYEVRRDQNLTMISPTNSFDDAVKILKNKSIISEKASKESKQSTGKQEVDIISKTIDMVNPYEYARGMDYELNIIDVPATSGDLHTDNVLRAQKKVLANLTKNPQYYFEKLYGKDKFDGDETVEINKKSTDAIGKGKNAKVIREGLGDKQYLDALRNSDANSIESAKKVLKRRFKDLDDKNIEYLAKEWAKRALDEGLEGDHITKEDIADELSNRGASNSEIEQYLNSLERSGDEYETLEDYVEDFEVYVQDKSLEEEYRSNQKITFTNKNSGKTYTGTVVQDLGNGKFTFKAEDGKTYNNDDLGSNWEIKSLNESYNPFPISEEQEAVLQRYSEATGITVENLKNMVAEAKRKKKAKKDYDGDGKIESSEEEYKGSRDKAIKQAIGEDIDLGHQDNEPHMVKADLYQIAKQASELYKIIDSVDNMGEVDFPSWWQAKITLAKSYLEGAKDYLESALATGNEDDLDESGTYAGKQSIPDAQQDPQFSSLSSTGKADALKKLQNGDTVTI